jgi:hypothetical protein
VKAKEYTPKKRTVKAKAPGPWEIGLLSNCSDGFPDSLAVLPAGSVASGLRGLAICLVSAASTATEEDEANARLIAAAPDLLDCVRRIRDMVATDGRLVGWASSDLDYLNSVLAKAEGRSL